MHIALATTSCRVRSLFGSSKDAVRPVDVMYCGNVIIDGQSVDLVITRHNILDMRDRTLANELGRLSRFSQAVLCRFFPLGL